MTVEQMFEQMYYNDFTEKGAQIGIVDGILSSYQRMTRDFQKLWMYILHMLHAWTFDDVMIFEYLKC